MYLKNIDCSKLLVKGKAFYTELTTSQDFYFLSTCSVFRVGKNCLFLDNI